MIYGLESIGGYVKYWYISAQFAYIDEPLEPVSEMSMV